MVVEYANTKSKGDEAELQVLLFLKRNGYAVSLPFGENAPYDLVAESPKGSLHRLQVRWCNWKNGALSLSLRKVSKNYARTLDRKRIDAFIAWDGETAFVIPTKDTMGCRAEFRIRDGGTRNGQSKGVRRADHYREAVHLIP